MDCRVAGLSQRKRPAQVVCLGVCTPPRHHERRPRGLRAGASSGCRGCGVGGPGAVSHAFLCRGTGHRGPRMGDGGGGSAEPEEDARGPVTRAPCRLGAAPAGRSERGGPRPVQSTVPPPRALSPFHLHDTLANRPTACPPPTPHSTPGNGRGTRRARLARGDSVPERDGPIPTSSLPCRPTASRRHCSRRCPHRRPREGGGEGPPGRRRASRGSAPWEEPTKQ